MVILNNRIKIRFYDTISGGIGESNHTQIKMVSSANKIVFRGARFNELPILFV
jgi:hypothetical protein